LTGGYITANSNHIFLLDVSDLKDSEGISTDLVNAQ